MEFTEYGNSGLGRNYNRSGRVDQRCEDWLAPETPKMRQEFMAHSQCNRFMDKMHDRRS